MLTRVPKHLLEKVTKILKHFKTHFINMCTKWVNSKIFVIAMILFAVIGIMANCFNQPDIAMFCTICTVTGLGLASAGIGFEIQQVADDLNKQEPEKVSKRMTYREFYELKERR